MAADQTSRGFGALPCPRCGEDATITLRCAECDTEYPVSLVRSILARWPVVVAWIDAAPALDGMTDR